MRPQLSHCMVSMHARTGSNQTYNWLVCDRQHRYARHCLEIESYCGRWFAPPGYQSINWLNRHRPKQIGSIAGSSGTGFRSVGSVPPIRSSARNWPPGISSDPVCKVPPDKPPGYWLLAGGSNALPDSNSKILNNLNMRNRSLIPKSRERSCRQGGRWGDKNIRR